MKSLLNNIEQVFTDDRTAWFFITLAVFYFGLRLTIFRGAL
jgi:hypothetical protein